MPSFHRIFLLSILGCFLAACESTKDDSERPLFDLYQSGRIKMEKGKHEKAAEEFEKISQQHPYSPWVPKAQIMAGYNYFLIKKYTQAIGVWDNFLYLYPYHALAPYASYMSALCYEQQVGKIDRDVTIAEKAVIGMRIVINRYPGTPYAQDALKKYKQLLEKTAFHYMNLGYFYQTEKSYIAAFEMFRKVKEGFKESSCYPEALYRLSECAHALGLKHEEKVLHKMLTSHYGQTHWAQVIKSS